MARETEVARGERMVLIYDYLIRNKRREISTQEILKYLQSIDNVSLRNVQRDLKALVEIDNSPIFSSTLQGQRHFFIQPNLVKKLVLPIQKNGLLAFFLLKRLQPFFAPNAKSFNEISEAILDRTGEADSALFEDLDESLGENTVLFGEKSSLEIDSSMFNDLLTSLAKRKKLKVLYQKGNSEKAAERIVCPAKLILFKSELYFICMSEHDEKWDFYVKLCRIHKTELLDETFKADPKRIARIEKRLVDSFGILDESNRKPKKIRVQFPANPYYQLIFKEKKFHHTQKVSRDKNGNTMLTMTVPIGMDIVNWVLGWPEAEVLEPKELKEKLLMVGKELVGKYKN